MGRVHGDTQNTAGEGGKEWGGKRSGSGRKPSPDKQAGKTVSAYLSKEDAEYFAKWGDSSSVALRELIDRARKMWPNGI